MISPERKTIESIMSTSIKFSVPSYQRSFDWGKSELQELVDDLKEIKNSEDKDLFLGNFIFDTSDKKNYKIVDGQQRLTTISIIAIALREHAKKINELKVASELQRIITLNSSWSKEDGNRISVSENIKLTFDYISDYEWNGIFPDKINGKSVKRQVSKIKPIFNYMIKEFEKYGKDDLLDFISALMEAYVIVIKVENTEDVFSIFERTNARGLDLNIGDLLKNYIFSHGIEKFEDKWNEIILNAESSLQRMLKYFWVSRNGYIQQSKLYKELKGYGKYSGIEEFVEQLYEFSRYYKMAISFNSEGVKDWLFEIGLDDLSKNEDHYKRISRVFQSLKLFRVTQAYPLIYSIFECYKRNKPKSNKGLFNILELIEKYHFVNNVISGRIGNEVEKFYSENSEKFFNSSEDFSVLSTLFSTELKKKRAHKEEFVSNFIDKITYEQKNIALINYVFDRINNEGTKGAQRVEIYSPEKDLKLRNYNIEHFLPQDDKKNYILEDELEAFDKIGNLLVISRHSNSEFQHKSPVDKVKMIKNDPKHFGNLRYLMNFLEDYESKFENWNFKSIDKRSKDIAIFAYDNIWNF